tara:strand:- start:13247 stop:13696 length:450 start_codon:yes stop_codon:yes gene_type:complete
MNDINYQPSLLTPKEILEQWSSLKPHVEAALEHSAGEMNTFDLALLALVEKAHIWVCVDKQGDLATVIVTRFIHHTRNKILLIQTCGGSVEFWSSWLTNHVLLENFAKRNGCKSIQIWGRRGWERRLRNLTSDTGRSYRHLYQVYDMEI